MKKVAVITGTRAEYGILYPVLLEIKKHPKLKLLLIAGGMHLSQEFGYTIKEIENDGFKIAAKFDNLLSEDTGGRMARAIGVGVLEFVQIFELLKPEIILICGDREEPFAAAIAGVCLNIPVAHISGGDVGTGGHIDEAIRHAITKFIHIHFPSNKKAVERIIKMGEEPWRIHLVGLPSLDNILNGKLVTVKNIIRKFHLDLSKPVILVLQHPLSLDPENSAKQMRETMEAIREIGRQTIIVYPNADAGGKRMIEVIKKYEKYPFIKTFQNMPHKEYLSLMKLTSVLVGNSSSGIIEAPAFGLPVVNIGLRQEGRVRAKNIIDVDHNKSQIKKAIQRSLFNQRYRKRLKKYKSPYGDGKASKRIVEVLNKIKIDKKLLHKKITY